MRRAISKPVRSDICYGTTMALSKSSQGRFVTGPMCLSRISREASLMLDPGD
jgi:hypothetical protein